MTTIEKIRIPKLKNLTLKEIQEYHDSVLLGKTYRYTIRQHKKNETIQIDIKFFKENLSHLLGIQKVAPSYIQNLFKGKKGYDGIVNETITVDKLTKFDEQRKDRTKKLPSIERRLTHFFLMEELLLNCKIVKFSADKVDGFCEINSEFILFHDELGVRLHLGVVKEQDDKNLYSPETFIVRKIRGGHDRYTKCPPQVYMNILNCEVIKD